MNKFLSIIISVVFLFSCTAENKTSTNEETKNESTLNVDFNSSKTISPSKKTNN